MNISESPPPRLDQIRPMAVGANGMIACAEPLAAVAGLQVLKEGGNAYDAVIAAALVEDVMLPAMTSLGGDSFAVVYDAGKKECLALNGSGRAPAHATLEFFRERGYNTYLPDEGPLSVAVPGEVDTLRHLHEHFGSLPLERLMAPAIKYAEEGFPVNERLHARIKRTQDKLLRCPASSAVFLPEGKVPQVGTILYQKKLAQILKTLCRSGLRDFYEGEVAERIASELQKDQGLITYDDLSEHQTEMYAPIHTDYRGCRVYETGPPSHGLIVLESLNILRGYDVAGYGLDAPELIHTMIETKKLAYHDRLKYCGDPRFVDVDIDRLLSEQHARDQRQKIHPDRVMSHQNGLIQMVDGDTTYMCAADKNGNCVSFIHSISGVEFGSGYVAGDTGIIMNCRLGRGFSMHEHHPNVLQAGKRTMHTLNAYMVFKDGMPHYVGGTPGGDQQAQWNFQVLTFLLDFNLNVQQAAEHPRWFSFPSTDEIHLPHPFELRIENRFDSSIYQHLETVGHKLKITGPWGAGGVQLIQIDQSRGVFFGGSDPRIGGVALAF